MHETMPLTSLKVLSYLGENKMSMVLFALSIAERYRMAQELRWTLEQSCSPQFCLQSNANLDICSSVCSQESLALGLAAKLTAIDKLKAIHDLANESGYDWNNFASARRIATMERLNDRSMCMKKLVNID